MALDMVFSKFKRLFHIPTWVLVFLAVASIGALILDILFVFNINSFESITINGVEHHKGTSEYLVGINDMKRSFAFSGFIAMLAGVISTRTIYRRNKNNNTERCTKI